MSNLFSAAIVGIMFGALFVVINASDLPGGWPWVSRVIGAVLVVTAIEFGVRRAAPLYRDDARSGARAYWIAVGAEVVAIPLGSLVISQVIDRPESTVAWVVLVVGVHFLPACRFGSPGWTMLGLVLIVLAIGGALGTLAFDETWAAASAVLAGLAMLIFLAGADPRFE